MKREVAWLLCLMGTCCLLLTSSWVDGHEAHQREKNKEIEQSSTAAFSPDAPREKEFSIDKYAETIRWLGRFHPVILHFPIALIVMTAVAEILFLVFGHVLYNHASQFMITAAAIAAVPTALFGLALAYGAHYEGAYEDVFWWHRFFGIFIAFLTVTVAILKNFCSSGRPAIPRIYYVCLIVLFICVNITAFLGGELTFGLGYLLPPFLSSLAHF